MFSTHYQQQPFSANHKANQSIIVCDHHNKIRILVALRNCASQGSPLSNGDIPGPLGLKKSPQPHTFNESRWFGSLDVVAFWYYEVKTKDPFCQAFHFREGGRQESYSFVRDNFVTLTLSNIPCEPPNHKRCNTVVTPLTHGNSLRKPTVQRAFVFITPS